MDHWIIFLNHCDGGLAYLGLGNQLQCVGHLPLWDVLWGVALLGEFVVDEAELAALLTGRDSVQADVELGTVVRVGVPEQDQD